MKGQPLSPDELGRIYAYIWKDHKEKGEKPETLKHKFEKNPTETVSTIAAALQIEYDGRLMIVADPLDDPTNPPADYSSEQLQKIIDGTEKNYKMIFRMTC